VVIKVFKCATVVEDVLEDVNDFFVRDVDDGRALVEKALHVLAKRLALLLLDLR
jgi:hypothetical protein